MTLRKDKTIDTEIRFLKIGSGGKVWLQKEMRVMDLFCILTLCIWQNVVIHAKNSECCCSVAQSCPAVCNPTDCSMPVFPVLLYLLKFAQTLSIELVMPSKYHFLCCHLLLLPSILPSIRVFSNGSVLHIRWPKYWSFSFSISPSDEYSGLISFIDCFDLFAVQGTLKSLLQHHSLKTSIFWHSAFFMVQLSQP